MDVKTQKKDEIDLARARHFNFDTGRPFPTQGALNGLILRREENGFSRCLRKINNRLYVHLPSLDSWINDQTPGANNGNR